MLNAENQRLCDEVFKKYGYSHQLLKLAEECAELIQPIQRIAQGDISNETYENFMEEFIDVYIVQSQIIQFWIKNNHELYVQVFNEQAKDKLEKALKGVEK